MTPKSRGPQPLWWMVITFGLGLLQIWLLLIFIGCILAFWPSVYERLGKPDWGAARILRNSVLLFFATSTLGQALYTLQSRRLLVDYHLFFAIVITAITLIPIIALYGLTILFGEPIAGRKYILDILFTVLAVSYAAYVEFGTGTGLAPPPVAS